MQNQVKFLQDFAIAKAMIVDETIQEVGSGLNYNRKKWNELIVEVMENKIDTIVMANKDRFMRFGYDWFEKFLLKFGTRLLAINNDLLSPQEELVQDLISILHVFSCRIYGLCKYKKKLEEDEEIAKSIQSGTKANRTTKTKD